jgi:hypothetical protein
MELVHRYRLSTRLRGYNYASSGRYFVTILTCGRECLLGRIVDGQTQLSQIGGIAQDGWLKSPQIRKEIQRDAFVIMPNHIHGIIVITAPAEGSVVRTHGRASLQNFCFCVMAPEIAGRCVLANERAFKLRHEFIFPRPKDNLYVPKISACVWRINKCVRFRRTFFRPFLWASKERDNIHRSFIS